MSRTGFASRTVFESLPVDDIDESEGEEEILPSNTPAVQAAKPQQPAKTKTAAKKAAKAAAASKKALKVDGSAGAPAVQPTATTDAQVLDTNANDPNAGPASHLTPAPAGSQMNPLSISDEDTTHESIEPDDLPNGISRSIESVSPRESEMEKPDMHSFEVLGPDGKTHTGNVEILVTSSEPIIAPPLASKAEVAFENVAGKKKKPPSNAIVRALSGLLMVGGFIGLLLMGHIYMIVLVITCQTLVYKEITSLYPISHREPEYLDYDDDDRRDPWSKTLNWYFFAVTNYFLYGETIIYYFKHVVYSDMLLMPFATNHRFISFTLYCIGFIGFVTSLKKPHLKRQFSLFGWVHMSLLLIVVSSHFVVDNILEGMIWFWVPASLVICNDVWAYIWGVTTGRTPLLALSPKKTVEGFVGAIFSTILFGFVWGTIFMRFNYMICPVETLGVTAWSKVQCNPNSVFVWREWNLPFEAALPLIGKIKTVWWAPFQFHVLVMSIFASLVAPFGGFFASGFKRAFDIKDFGDSIPGHGGMTDRMDCQFLMGMFAYVYYSTVIRESHVTVGSLMGAAIGGLTADEQIHLYKELGSFLQSRGLLRR